jgi:type I restriction enzyme R subunit
MAFNENSRVKIPAILHLKRLGYNYVSLKNAKWDTKTNIFTDIFTESIQKINPDLDEDGIKRVLEEVTLVLDNEDLGQTFYKMLTATSGTRLIDFNNFDNNSFHVVTELPCKNNEEEFRPDITLLINGMPLAFVEVKKPNNHEGIMAERDRIDRRFQNLHFRRFVNISQLLVFTNNMEYDLESIVPIQGSFYCTTSYKKALFNCFREEDDYSTFELQEENDELENFILKDNNLSIIKHSPEFITNKDPLNPANRALTSLFSRNRLLFLLRYGIVYVDESTGLEKHVMRYPQLFATKAIESTLNKNIKKGIIWHTQGSGKTALAYFNVAYLADYYQQKGIIPKFYFIVDRIDLMTQASTEFTNRGLIVNTVNSKDDFVSDIKKLSAIHNHSGEQEITVINIQKFSDDSNVVQSKDYNLNIQRIYFLDEVHRSYNPTGSFLANLINSDRDAIIIGLTGTPLIESDRRSRDTFGNYIHKYYYNASIADGYTLRLIREGIETNYKIQMEQALQEIKVLKGDLDKKKIYAHRRFVEPMLEYIINDFRKSRIILGDDKIGAMVVCDSSEQAKMLYEIFQQKYVVKETETNYSIAAEPPVLYGYQYAPLTAALILHDNGTKEERKVSRDDFKDGNIDILFVYNMLLTGFDAKRLKKLYLGRVVKDHNLLQTLTRVNRPYKDFRYGYVVDFADIRKEFDKTNKAYFDELQQELGDEMENYSNLFKSPKEVEEEIKDIKEKLFHFDLWNAEIFSQQISEIEDRKQILEIKKALLNAKNLYNLIRTYGYFDLLDKIDFRKLNTLYNEVSRHLDLLNLKDAIQNSVDTTNLLNVALEDVVFLFRKISEEELILADQLKDTLRKTREALNHNFDQQDPEFISLYEELKRMFDKKNLDEITQEEMKANIGALQQIYDAVMELNRRNNLLKAKYENDAKYARIHKRLIDNGVSKRESELRETLIDIKHKADEKVLINTNLLNAEAFFNREMLQLVIYEFQKHKMKLDVPAANFINHCVVKEYMNEFHGRSAW